MSQRGRKDDRNAELLRLRNAGWSFDDLATRFGITGVRAQQIAKRERERRGEEQPTGIWNRSRL